MRINIKDEVMVHEEFSLRFANRWGTVVDIVWGDPLPIKLKFPNSAQVYGFSTDELVTKNEFAGDAANA